MGRFFDANRSFQVVIFFSCLISAQNKETLFLWPDEVPGEIEVKHKPVPSDNVSGNVNLEGPWFNTDSSCVSLYMSLQ